MANCYRCGRLLEADEGRPRRKVRTGEHTRTRYPNATLVSIQTHYGMRVVCRGCAKRIDRNLLRTENFKNLQVLVLLAALIIYVLLRQWF